MSDQDSQSRSFPVDRFPGPVCRYVFRDGSPVIDGVNSGFEAQFGAVHQDVTLSDAFDSLDIGIVDGNDIVTTLENSDRVVVESSGANPETGSERYLVKNVPPSDEESGFLVFVESADTDAGGDLDSTLDGKHIATILSHDLRNPLDVAKSRLRAGQELDDDEHFEHVEWAHARMEHIIDEMLELARLGQELDQREVIDPEPVARTAWKTVETTGATLTVEDHLPTVVADSDRLLRLFENLFRNCVEHGTTSNPTQSENDNSTTRSERTPSDCESGSGSVSISIGPLEGSSIDGFYVADDGPGIPPGERTSVFDPGYSLDGDGTGLGLAIVSRIVDAHGWSIDVTTGADGGARFEVTGVTPVDGS
jgi:nitrogen-specific signal transduction histidine kinase